MGHYAACRLETLIASELFCRLEGRHGRLIQIFSKVISICYAPAVTHDPFCAERFQSSLQCWFHGCFVRVRGGYSYSKRWRCGATGLRRGAVAQSETFRLSVFTLL